MTRKLATLLIAAAFALTALPTTAVADQHKAGQAAAEDAAQKGKDTAEAAKDKGKKLGHEKQPEHAKGAEKAAEKGKEETSDD